MLDNKKINCFAELQYERLSFINACTISMELSAFHPLSKSLASGYCSSAFSYDKNNHLDIKKAGRRTGDDTLILSVFLRGKNNKPPKKEYLRCQLIRGHKRIIRNLGRDIIPLKTLNKAKICRETFDTYEKLKACYEKNKEVLDIACQTVKGPKTDGKAKRQKINETDRDISNSYNNKFCTSYFESPVVRESYQLYIDYLFVNASPSELIKKFKFSCCKSENHEDECVRKWNFLRFYVSNKMITDLGIQPWGYRDVTILSQEQEAISQTSLKINI